ncbi:E3 ubiquitin-protein ligase rnf8 isoform X1 [Rhodamnia argentea]|uniref:RING-type E3 ubiquitin transferase BRCA1 n=1 Tax=Rhodamnia argentea TaxID=178133 RepID=A0A8B8QNB7_9MYRT|nr:E3 ubiquitin-protein ligase rnf8 isoform X2 [Rhodamnia argentea]XP_030547964.1 E3 ubiquitin-protein ligase rnf8 isoform X1 [Rhodamnia argentea]
MAHEGPPDPTHVIGPVRGMESVVASVSGYHGSERFDLIKLISSVGASYVGAMSSSTTHLVCRRFEGQKYDLARKFKTHVVNHWWVEECIKQGKRVPEHPYTLESGEEAGPLLLPVPINPNPYIMVKKHKVLFDGSNFASSSMRQITDSAFEDNGTDVWTDSHLLKECPELNRSSKRSLRGKRITTPHEESHVSPSRCFGRREVKLFSGKGDSSSAESSKRRRNLVKRNAKRETLKLTASDSDRECYVVGVDDTHRDLTTPSEHLNGEFVGTRKGGTRNGFYGHEGAMNGIIEDVDEIQDWNHDHRPSPEELFLKDLADTLERVSKDEPNSEKLRIEIDDVSQTDYINSLPSSVELSCVICWTEYSSTRGILPCGHRFCYSCIRNWSDHMSSRRKTSTCPLCKISFVSITKVEDSSGSEQKVYSQTIPHDQSTSEVYVVTDQERTSSRSESFGAQVCSECHSREPEDLLISCHLCHTRCIHSYCLDPPLLPWTCVHCKDLQMLFHLPR